MKSSLKNIEVLNLNRTNGTAQYGLTKYSDMLPEEFLESKLVPDLSSQLKHILLPNINLDLDENSIEKIQYSVNQFNIPQKVDWREQNVVTKVQSQDLCSACWAFAAIGVIESMYAIKTGKLENFSIQELIDCSKYNYGCDGGNVCTLLDWMKTDQVKVVRDAEYPLTDGSGNCRNVSSNGIEIQDYACNK
ncbi:hypothetical protein NQ314_015123 [Rhamnusium bicolor]|uniref:Peptidase C1A papain C-terminal domain-containing protein n=1 Tax=Rhamnusium bicolor TaxID=1586634 RepID=A0AAV8X0I7_9CUCU|nr:hypothetical protein NQ314_015123 [Rhamnusium bicolor]